MRFGLGHVRPGLLTSSDEPYPCHGFDIAERRFTQNKTWRRAQSRGKAAFLDHGPEAGDSFRVRPMNLKAGAGVRGLAWRGGLASSRPGAARIRDGARRDDYGDGAMAYPEDRFGIAERVS
jgi:hypothetical protein